MSEYLKREPNPVTTYFRINIHGIFSYNISIPLVYLLYFLVEFMSEHQLLFTHSFRGLIESC